MEKEQLKVVAGEFEAQGTCGFSWEQTQDVPLVPVNFKLATVLETHQHASKIPGGLGTQLHTMKNSLQNR